MKFDKKFWKNPNVYTALALIPIFLWFGGYLPNTESAIPINNTIFRFLVNLLFLLGAGSSTYFIITRIWRED